MNPKCPKCGASMMGPFYQRARALERLRYECRCGYSLTRPTKDQLERRPAPPTEGTP